MFIWDYANLIQKGRSTRIACGTRPGTVADLFETYVSYLTPNDHRSFFPSAKAPSRSVSHNTLYAFIRRQRERGVIPHATNRDLRRTWKTLDGKAGLTKEIRDRIQP